LEIYLKAKTLMLVKEEFPFKEKEMKSLIVEEVDSSEIL
jgi:hypothetical protein